MRQLVRKPASWAKRGPNARKTMGDPEKAKALALSRIANQLTPLVARTNAELIDGFRTIWGLELLGKLDAELDFILTDENLTPVQIEYMQGVSAIHREDWPLADKCEWIIKLLETQSAKQIAAELGVDAAMITNWKSYERLIPEAKQAVRDGRVGVRRMVTIAKLDPDDQPANLATLPKSEASDQAEGKKPPVAPATTNPAKTSKTTSTVKIAFHGGTSIVVKSETGLTLADVAAVLLNAHREANRGKEQGLSPASFQRVMADRAKKDPDASKKVAEKEEREPAAAG